MQCYTDVFIYYNDNLLVRMFVSRYSDVSSLTSYDSDVQKYQT